MERQVSDIGSRLQQARERRGLSLRDLANTTKISVATLNSIEHNDFARLPGGIFSRSYVRTFAAEVGLNGHELVSEYRRIFETQPPAEPDPPGAADTIGRSSTIRLLAVSATGIGMAMCALLFTNRAPDQTPTDHAPTMEVIGGGVPETSPASQGDGEDELSAQRTAADGVAPALRLDIRPTGLCWVSAVADGKVVIYRLMQPGEETTVEARQTVELRVGDAAAVAYWINGTKGRPLGGPGEAVTVHITEENRERLYAAPPAGAPGVTST
jgi:cytoskeletal protein RodZ